MTAGDLARFVAAQEGVIDHALAELRAGAKRSHWMWFVFPQVAGLGQSPTARHFAIGSAGEARRYLAHPVLGPRLHAAAAAMMTQAGLDPAAVLGGIDAAKLRSSMTLFAAVAPDPAPFNEVLDAFYAGERDPLTLAFLDQAGAATPPAGPTGASSPRE